MSPVVPAPDPIRDALYDRLAGDTDLASLLPSGANSIFHREAPEGSAYPLVIFHHMSGVRQWTYDDFTYWALWAVKGVSREQGSQSAETIDRVITARLDEHALVIPGPPAHRCLVLRRESDLNYGEPKDGERVHHVGGLYRLVTQPTS